MSTSSLSEIDCGVAKTLSVVGEWWGLMILRNAFHGMRTFDAFQENLNISTSVLSARLKTLTEAGVLERRRSETDGRSYEYRLTEAGFDLYPIIVGLLNWGEKWDPSPDGKRMRLYEKATGEEIFGAAVITRDGRRLDPREVRAEAGPGASPKVRALTGKVR